jgi:hypothetical protein
MGMKVAAVSVLCQDKRVFNGMMMAGTPCPYLGSIGAEAKTQWEENNYQPPTFEKEIKPKETKGDDDKTGLAIFGGLAALLFLL